jgi:hypothetical protein
MTLAQIEQKKNETLKGCNLQRSGEFTGRRSKPCTGRRSGEDSLLDLVHLPVSV